MFYGFVSCGYFVIHIAYHSIPFEQEAYAEHDPNYLNNRPFGHGEISMKLAQQKLKIMIQQKLKNVLKKLALEAKP